MKTFSKQGSLKTLKSTSSKSLISKSGEKSKVPNNDAKSLAKYYDDLEKVQPKIDNKPPKFNIDVYYKPRNLVADAQTVMEIDKNNLDLLKKLNEIHRMGGKVDCWNLDFKYKLSLDDGQSNAITIINENKELLTRIQRATGLYCTADLMRDWRQSRAAAVKSSEKGLSNATRSVLRLTEKKISRSARNGPSSRTMDDLTRPRCYFVIQMENEDRRLGKMIFQLFTDVVPKTCENFLSFCRGFNGRSYRGTPFHRILPDYWCQGGDVTKFNGSGGTSIYGDNFEDENFELRHCDPGILSTCSYAVNTNDSKFNLTFKKLETVDGKKVVFGKLISGLSTLRELERFGTKNGRPITKIIVARCGIM